jgi:hypothetical protein
MIGYTVEIKGLEEAVKAFSNSDHIFQQELTKAMDQSVKSVLGSAKKAAPVGVSGEMRASLETEVKPIGSYDVEGAVGSPLPYAIYVEMGTKPHYPPIEPLLLWVKRKKLGGTYSIKTHRRMGGKKLQMDEDMPIARAIQRKIGKFGTKPTKFLENAFIANGQKIDGYFIKALDRIVQRLATE